MNELPKAASAYLRSAMHQPIAWNEWGPVAFARAASENKPVLLDIGAVWCHWCHVMDRESYEDAAIAALINEKFVAIKVDRDERPDVDARYQAAVSAISGQGGWPLTVFLTPQGKPFFGGTYFPRQDHYGRPGFERVLTTMADVFHTRAAEMEESAASVMNAVAYNESFAGRAGEISPDLLRKMIASAVAQFDPRNGGFGAQPKFPRPAAIDMLLDDAARTGDAGSRDAALVTLHKMAAGGVFDQLAGGFHRYSVDERWVVPHFEKMLYDNAGLLGNYVHAFQTFADPACAATARDIIRFLDEVLSHRDSGGFYASQDADISLDDDGDYFTWTRAEAAAILSPDEMRVAALYYNIGDIGDMQHDPSRNVLHVKYSLDYVAKQLSLAPETARDLLSAARGKLYAARLQRKTPFIDRTIYVHWNALAISASLEAGAVLGLPEVAKFALRSLDRILHDGWSPADGLAHVIAYADGATPSQRAAGLLDDYAYLVQACLDAWQASGELRYYSAGRDIADAMIARFYDATTPGFFDAELDPNAIGALAVPRKPLQDAPTPAGNPSAASALLRLHDLSGEQRYRDIAEATLESFAGVVEHFGLYAGTYALALRRLLSPAIEVCIVGSGPNADQLAAAARIPWLANKNVTVLSPEQIRAGLPPALAQTIPHLPANQTTAIVCTGNACLAPVTTAADLAEQLAPLTR